MVRKKWPIAIGIACVALIAITAFRPVGQPIGWRQSSEGNGHRSAEYGAFGLTFYQTDESVPELQVSGDFRAALAAMKLKNPPEVEAQADKAFRTIRRGGTQYWLRIDVKSKPKDVIDAYSKQIIKASRSPIPGGADEIRGTAPDGKTYVRIYAADLGGGKTDVLLTFGPGA